MSSIILQEQNGKILASSREVAEKFGKQNKNVNEAIRTLIRKNPEISPHFVSNYYKSSRGRFESEFLLDEVALEIIESKFRYNIRSARFEYKIINELSDFFSKMKIKIELQFPVLQYKIDIYLPEYNLAIEIDEDEHKFRQSSDEKRQKEIETDLNCKFIRIEENESLGNAMAKIINEIAVLKTP